MSNKKYLVAKTPPMGTLVPSAESGDLYGGIYGGLTYLVYDDVTTLNNYLSVLTQNNKVDEVQSIQMIPSDFVCTKGSTTPQEYSVTVYKPYTSVGGYTNVRNNKLFTYPYKCLSVYNCEGESVDLRYEYFNGADCLFYLRGIMSLEPVIMCLPRQYMGESLSYTNAITMRNFPKCSWASDSYKAYIAQMMSNMPANLMATAIPAMVGIGLGYATGGTANAVMSGTMSLVGNVSQLLGATAFPPVMPNKSHGTQTSDILYAGDVKEFYFYKKSIRGEMAEVIDNYFTMFGYADRTVHQPQMNVRTRFTYVKTIGCKINCRCPASDANFIEELFNRGIRFWKDHTQIGDYSTANLPLSAVTP